VTMTFSISHRGLSDSRGSGSNTSKNRGERVWPALRASSYPSGSLSFPGLIYKGGLFLHLLKKGPVGEFPGLLIQAQARTTHIGLRQISESRSREPTPEARRALILRHGEEMFLRHGEHGMKEMRKHLPGTAGGSRGGPPPLGAAEVADPDSFRAVVGHFF